MLRFYLSKNPTSALAVYHFKDSRFSFVDGNDSFSSFFGEDISHFPEAFVSEKHLCPGDKSSFLSFFKNLETAEEETSLSFSCYLPSGSRKLFEIIAKKEKDFSILLINDKTESRSKARKFQLYQAVVSERSLACLEIDLIDNFAILTGGKEKDRIWGTNRDEMYYTEFLNHFLSLIDDDAERENAKEQFSLQSLINSYKHGQKDVGLIFSSLNFLKGKKCRALNQLVVNSQNGHICSIFSVINVSPFYSKIEELTVIADTDPLTKLYNRYAFEKKTKPFFEDGDTHVLLLMDIDNFKDINDQYGHMMGDKGLCLLANLLNKTFGERGIVGRYGGDEFLIVLKDGSDFLKTKKTVQHFQEEIKEVFHKSGLPFDATVSCGATFFGKRARKSYETAFREVDKALYFAKSCGKNYVFFYEIND